VRPLLEAIAQASDGPIRVANLLPDHGPMLWALWMIGAVRLLDSAASVAPAPSEDLFRPVSRLESELRTLRSRLENETHFQILEVSEQANDAEIRQAFLRLAKRFHPDRVAADGGDLRGLASEVFAGISEAHRVLADPTLRRDYRAQVARAAEGEDSPCSVERILTAETQFQRADELLKRKDYAGAIQALEWALELNPDEGEFHALYGWAAYLHGSGGEVAARTAMEHLRKSISLAPKSPAGYYYLGKLYKACEEVDRAENMFRKVLELWPRHVEATQELRLLALRRGKSGPAGKGGKGSVIERSLFGLGAKTRKR